MGHLGLLLGGPQPLMKTDKEDRMNQGAYRYPSLPSLVEAREKMNESYYPTS
jgi:hypothetical protein